MPKFTSSFSLCNINYTIVITSSRSNVLKLPVGACIQLLQCNPIAIAYVAQVSEASIYCSYVCQLLLKPTTIGLDSRVIPIVVLPRCVSLLYELWNLLRVVLCLVELGSQRLVFLFRPALINSLHFVFCVPPCQPLQF